MATYIQTCLSKVEILILQKTARFSLGKNLVAVYVCFLLFLVCRCTFPFQSLQFFFMLTSVLQSSVVYICFFFISCSLLHCLFTNFFRCSEQWYIHLVICFWSENLHASMYLMPEFCITQTGSCPVGNRSLRANSTTLQNSPIFPPSIS